MKEPGWQNETPAWQWGVSALSSIEMAAVPWWFLGVSGHQDNGLTSWMDRRLAHFEAVLGDASGSRPIASPWRTC